MVENKPSIYNAQSVYNQGGGSGAFDVDIGGGVSQTLVFPPYLKPVEYIDTSNISDNKFSLFAANQVPIISNRNNLYCKFSFKVNRDKMSGTTQKNIFCYREEFSSGTTEEIKAYVNLDNNLDKVSLAAFLGPKAVSFYPIDVSKKIILTMDATNSSFTIDIDGLTNTKTNSNNLINTNIGVTTLYNYQNISTTIFLGRIYFGYIKNKSTNEILSMMIPARAIDDNDKKPYFVECVSGSVAINGSSNLPGGYGIEFGPDIDLSEEIPNWIT